MMNLKFSIFHIAVHNITHGHTVYNYTQCKQINFPPKKEKIWLISPMNFFFAELHLCHYVYLSGELVDGNNGIHPNWFTLVPK